MKRASWEARNELPCGLIDGLDKNGRIVDRTRYGLAALPLDSTRPAPAELYHLEAFHTTPSFPLLQLA